MMVGTQELETPAVARRPAASAGGRRAGATTYRRLFRLLRTPLGAGLAVLAIYVGLSFLVNPRGYLGTDEGGKVATLEAMDRRGDFDPDVGYWAERWDPSGALHPLYYTESFEDRWVNVTTLPMVVVARPLYSLGGYRLALLLPMLGSVAAAFAARRIARWMGAGDVWLAFWVIALASPLAVYALDFWEHAIGLGLLAWTIVVLLAIFDGKQMWWRGLVAGLLIGIAFSMRTEALVYGFVAVGSACIALLWRQRAITRSVVLGVTVLVGLGAAVAGNAVLESQLLGSVSRTERASGAAQSGGVDLQNRLDEGLTTFFSLHPTRSSTSILLGAGFASLLAYGAWKARRGERDLSLLALVGASVLAAARFGWFDLGFVPGLVAATPLAAAALALSWRYPRARALSAAALLALPIVWYFQYQGGAGPQWGGRYTLTSGLVLAIVGVVTLGQVPPRVRRWFLALALVITGLGVAWLIERSHGIAGAGDDLARRPEPVLVSTQGFWLREFGPAVLDHRWLTALGRGEVEQAAAVIEAAGFSEFGLLQEQPEVEAAEVGPPELKGWLASGTTDYTWLGTDFRVTTYRLDQ